MYTEAFEQNYFAQSCLIPAGIQPQKLIKLQLTEAIIEIVRAGMGITVMPEWLASRYIEEGDLKLVIDIGKIAGYISSAIKIDEREFVHHKIIANTEYF